MCHRSEVAVALDYLVNFDEFVNYDAMLYDSTVP